MTSERDAVDAFSQFDELTSKRAALEKLIHITTGIQRQQRALEQLALVAKPSQEFPPKIAAYLEKLEHKYSELADELLNQRLVLIERSTNEVIGKIAKFAHLGIDELRYSETQELSVEAFQNLIKEFEQRTQSSLTLRFLLKKRGLSLNAFKLPFPQDAIAEQVETLKDREDHCVVQIKTEAQTIIKDTRALLTKPSVPDKMKQQLQEVEQAMVVNLKHLADGGSVASIPNKFEVVILQAGPSDKEEPVQGEEPAPEANEAEPSSAVQADSKAQVCAPQKKLSTFRLFIKWLNTPMGVSWKMLKAQNDRLEK
jgi:hypothetical protein